MSPRFLFKIDEIGESATAVSHHDNTVNWRPSTAAGANVLVGGGVSGLLWYCNTQQIYHIGQPLPAQSVLHSEFSVYFGAGYGFWVLYGDATQGQASEVWHPLSFDHHENNYSSFLTNAGSHSHMRIQRPDQQWPSMLLPDIYHAPAWTQDQNYGGLTGELPILLALIALSMPPSYLPQILPNMFAGGAWQVHGYRLPRTPKRGVVVKVYTCPADWGASSTSQDLEDYENGDLGKYYN